jgi:hypothetical protein
MITKFKWGYNYFVPTPTKQLKYQDIYLIWPGIAYGCYILLSGVALLRQRTGNTNINFMFLLFWGIWLFLATVLLSLLGFVHRRKFRRILLVVNIAVSLAIIVATLAALTITYKTQPENYTCEDYVRCLFSPDVNG